jgi:hypothetical protein
VSEHTFTTGAKRSAVKAFFSAIPHMSLLRLAMRATGAPKGAPPATLTVADHTFEYSGGSRGYGYGNWALGLEMEDTFNHIIDHLYHWKHEVSMGRRPSDDDLAAAAWGIMFPLMTFEREYAANELRKSLEPEIFKPDTELPVARPRRDPALNEPED